MNKEISTCIECSQEKDPKEKWEILKKRIKKSTSEFARKNASMNKIIIANLSEKAQ